MTDYERNVYYHPEASGLAVVAEIEYSDRNYVYDTRVVWRHESGKLLTARDSGCSCPTPFEEYDVMTLEEADITSLTREVAVELRNDFGHVITKAEGLAFLRKVEAAL